ncbi:MAG: hypothetical protein HY735_18680 [Verrucomicrobia bacterium]|nr:hypothetical protein [Verrucomicrobiota bacterium]
MDDRPNLPVPPKPERFASRRLRESVGKEIRREKHDALQRLGHPIRLFPH